MKYKLAAAFAAVLFPVWYFFGWVAAAKIAATLVSVPISIMAGSVLSMIVSAHAWWRWSDNVGLYEDLVAYPTMVSTFALLNAGVWL